MPRYFKNAEPISKKKKDELEKVWKEVKAELKNKPEVVSIPEPVVVSAEEPSNDAPVIIPEATPVKKGMKKTPLIITAVLAVLFAGLLVWYLLFFKSSVTISVEDQSGGVAISNATVVIENTSVTTNEDGRAYFEGLKTGEKIVKVTYSGYKETAQYISLKRGDNGTITVSLDLVRMAVSGLLLDYVDKQLVVDARASINESSATSDSQGLFTVDGVLPGDQILTVTHPQYYDFSLDFVTTRNREDNLGDMMLTPKGRIIFSSNRDSDQAIYISRFDGTEEEKLFENLTGFDDSSPLLSPNQKWLLFFSTRENVRDDYGNLKAKPYMYNFESKSVTKISDDTNISPIIWQADGDILIYLSSENAPQSRTSYAIKSYNYTTQQLSVLVTNSQFESPESSNSASLSQLIASSVDKRLAFVVKNYSDETKTGIYSLLTEAGELKKLSAKTPSSEFSFSEDGKKLTYDSYQSGTIRRYSYDLATSRETPIAFDENRTGYYSSDSGYEFRQAFTGDKTKKAFIDYRDGKNNLFYANADGSDERKMTQMGGVDKVFFAGGGRYLVFSVNLTNEASVYVMGTAPGSIPVKIVDLYPSSLAGIVSQ